MYLENNLVRKIGDTDPTQIQSLTRVIDSEFSAKWVERSLQIMKPATVLKAITPTNIDRLDPKDETRLKTICLPLIEPYRDNGSQIVYLDISNLPSGAQSKVHFDYGWIHALSRRVLIPLKTNSKAVFAALDHQNNIRTFHLSVGHAYEVNNFTLHAVSNFGPTDRWHIVADIMDNDSYEYLKRNSRLDKTCANRWCNYHFSPNFLNQIEVALKSPPTESQFAE